MPIDFRQVTTITIPEGSVTKITDSNGNILWQGVQSEGWHTIWEGNKTITLTKSGTNDPVISGEEKNFAQTVAETGKEPKIRITFSYSNTNTDYNNWENIFIINTNAQTAAISSPVTIDAVRFISSFFSTNVCIIICDTPDSIDNGAILGVGLKSMYSKKNNMLNISLTGHKSGNMSYNGHFTITFTVTKIEQYY